MHISNNKPSSNAKVSPQGERISHSVFLLGDAGDTKKSPASIELLRKHLEDASKQSSLIFLGDNLYPSGVPPKTDKAKRKSAEEILDAQLRILQNYKGRPIFIPGNHDWERYRLKGLHRQEKYIESQLNQGIEDEEDWTNYFMPDRGCPGPEIIEVNDKLVILLIDTEWWLMNWNLEPNINEGCGISNREELSELIEDAIKKHRNKNIIIATHHPMRTTGPHGGKFTLKEHIFPITMASKDFYLPLPILGSLVIGIRNSGVIRQDINHKNYRKLEKALVGIAQKYGSFIFVSGHEHSLQYHQDKGQHFIVSGAGSKATATAVSNKTMFSYGNLGFSKIDVYEDGSAWVEFWVPEENSALGKRIYRYKMKDALKAPKPAEIPTSFPEYDQKLSSKTVFPIKTKVKQTKKTETFMLGHHYRNIYLEKYEFPILDLSTYKGGFRILKKGGGKQTNSLRMINPAGKEYVLRSLTKDVSRTVPYPFNQMPLINYLFIDNFLGTHPFAPLVIGDLADAAKVYHTNPQIYYVPKQPALGSYNDMFGGEVYLFEERPSKSWPDLASFGNAVKFSNSYDLIDKMEKNNKHRVDQKWAARSRIFDVLIGDWDRHEDQWRWTVTKDEGGYKLYRPIPRDRDQAFSKYDGFAIKILSPYNVFLHQISDYDDKMNNFKWNTYNSRHFDNTFLNELDLEDWKNEASYIKEHLTDDVIENAFKNLTPKVYDLSAKQIMTVLKSRRDKLQIIAEGMYEELAQKVTIVGTEKKDYFEIIRKENGETEINRYDSNKKGEKKERLYHRIFKDSETKSVFIYGLGDDDIFHMSGKADRGFRIHLMGAHGDDTYIDESKVSGAGKKHKIHDTKTGNKLQLGTESKDLTSNVVVNNQYDRHGKQNDENMFFAVPLVGFNG
ncbi:MAG: metallophosphoesterase, partial [Bacteroidota bacterium]